MRHSRFTVLRPVVATATILAAMACDSAFAAKQNTASEAQRRYLQESASCMKMRDHDERANCLSEASTRRAAYLPTPSDEAPDVLLRNALRRCEPLPDVERSDCVARIQGQGTASGSVAAGGIYRELVIREVGAAPAPASTPTPTPK